MATLVRQKIVGSGLTPSYAACAGGGDVVDNADGRTFLHVKNGSGGSITVTVTAQDTSAQTVTHGTLTVANIAVAIPAGQERMIGPFPKQAFNNASKQLALSYSGVTSLTIAAVYMDAP
jgi:hypothetical protein